MNLQLSPNNACSLTNPIMKKLQWFERSFNFGSPKAMLPFYLERLQGTVVRIEKKVKGIPEEILSNRLDNKWSVKENIGHLGEVDEIANKRISEIISGVSPMSPAVFEPQPYHEWPIRQVIEYFQKNRINNIERYRQLTADELDKSSVHPRLKVSMTPVDLALFDAEHDDHHLVRINEILDSLFHMNPYSR
jgi:hypothetical protein